MRFPITQLPQKRLAFGRCGKEMVSFVHLRSERLSHVEFVFYKVRLFRQHINVVVCVIYIKVSWVEDSAVTINGLVLSESTVLPWS